MVWDSVQLWGREKRRLGVRAVWSAGLPMGCAGPAGRLLGAHRAQHNVCLLLLPLAFSDQWKASPVFLEPDSWGLALEERVLDLGSWIMRRKAAMGVLQDVCAKGTPVSFNAVHSFKVFLE